MLFVAIGGGLGGLCRVLLSRWLTKWRTVTLTPVLWINWLGSFALGLTLRPMPMHARGQDAASLSLLGNQEPLTAALWLGLTVGFLGSFTTFSTFSVEALQLLLGRHYGRAAWYVGLSLLGSVGWFAVGLTWGCGIFMGTWRL